MKKIILLGIGAILLQIAYAQNEKPIDWDSDLDYLSKELPERHYNLFSKYSRADFTAGIDAIRSANDSLNDFQTALKIQQLIAKSGDSHTSVGFTSLLDINRILPINLLWTSNGLHVLHTNSENKTLLGRRITAINDISIETLADSLSTLFPADNEAIVKLMVPRYIPYLQILEYFGIAAGSQVELTLDTGETYTLVAATPDRRSIVSFKPDSMAFCIKNAKIPFTASYFPDERIYYMLYNTCWSRELEAEHGNIEKAERIPSFNAFENDAFGILESQPVDKIIFDMRNNQGGSSLQGTAFIEKLAAFLKKNPTIKTYVVLGRATFSSAILNAMDFKRLTNAVFVGEETSGKPNHFGEVKNFQLPDSRLYVFYSTKYFKRTAEEVNTITPDIEIEMSFEDLTKGVDPVFEWIKEQPVKK